MPWIFACERYGTTLSQVLCIYSSTLKYITEMNTFKNQYEFSQVNYFLLQCISVCSNYFLLKCNKPNIYCSSKCSPSFSLHFSPNTLLRSVYTSYHSSPHRRSLVDCTRFLVLTTVTLVWRTMDDTLRSPLSWGQDPGA